MEQAARFTTPAVDALTRVDIACRHLGTKRAVKRPPQSPREGRPGRAKKCPPTARAGERVPASRRSRVREYTGSRRQRLLAPPNAAASSREGEEWPCGPKRSLLVSIWFGSPLMYPAPRLVHVCSRIDYKYRKGFLRGRFCMAKSVRHAQLHTTKFPTWSMSSPTVPGVPFYF